jgi:hypothetical protein
MTNGYTSAGVGGHTLYNRAGRAYKWEFFQPGKVRDRLPQGLAAAPHE